MRKTRALTLVIVMVTLACGIFSRQAVPTPNVEASITAAATVIIARITEQAGATATARQRQATEQSVLPTTEVATPMPATLTYTPTPPLPLTLIPPTAVPTSQPCNRAGFVSDVTVPPNSIFPVRALFTKIWRVQNNGSCTWTTNYALVFASGDPLGGAPVILIPGPVQPGQTVDLAVTLTAPAYAGLFLSNWMLRNASGVAFGTGSQANMPLQVLITTYQPVVPSNNASDFASNYCTATWTSAVGPLYCQGNSQDPAGSVTLLNQPALESPQAIGLALWTRPNAQVNGWIRGEYPAYLVKTNDHFQAEIGCLLNSRGCDLTFQIDYQALDGTSGRIGAWREFYDGQTTLLDIDLTPLAGRMVQFILTVINNGDPQSDNAFWLAPRIQNLGSTKTLVLNWSQEATTVTLCRELSIYTTGLASAEAEAFSCAPNELLLGSGSLSLGDVDQLVSWVEQFSSFDSQIYEASKPQPITIWIHFHGVGSSPASDSAINAINKLAEQIYNSIVP